MKENKLNLIIGVILLIVVAAVIMRTVEKQSYINGQINGYILGCKNTGVAFDECERRSVRYERWL